MINVSKYFDKCLHNSNKSCIFASEIKTMTRRASCQNKSQGHGQETMTTTFNVYKSTDGELRLENYTATYPNWDWDQFLEETGQTERLERLYSMSSRQRSGRVNRLRKTEAFLEWQKGKAVTVTSKLLGVATADYDGRISERLIQYAILDAIKIGKDEALYYPKSNEHKSPLKKMVYVIPFNFEKK